MKNAQPSVERESGLQGETCNNPMLDYFRLFVNEVDLEKEQMEDELFLANDPEAEEIMEACKNQRTELLSVRFAAIAGKEK